MVRSWGGLALVAAALVLVGCATVVRGTTEAVTFDSEPSGAEMRSMIDHPCGGPCPTQDDRLGSAAYVNEDVRTEPIPGPSCTTPCTIQVARNQGLVATFSKPGYQPQTVKLATKVSGGGAAGVAGNVLIGGAIGLVTDGVTGAGMDHQPNPLKVVLVPVAPASAPPAKKRKVSLAE